MEYFVMKTSVNSPFTTNGKETMLYPHRLSEENYQSMPAGKIYYYEDKEDIEIPELLVQPTFMVGDALRQIINVYDETIEWKALYMMPNEEEKVVNGTKRYSIPNFTRWNCLHEDAQIAPNGEVLNLVLDKSKLRNAPIFQVEETIGNYVIVSLELAESISRRHLYGVRVERVEVK